LPTRARIGERENEMKKQKTEDAVPFEKTEGEIAEQKQGRRPPKHDFAPYPKKTQ